MTSREIVETAAPILEPHADTLAFAVLFGSAAQERLLAMSDIDIGIVTHDSEAYVKWAKWAILSYLDTQWLRERSHAAMRDRLKNGTFGRGKNVG